MILPHCALAVRVVQRQLGWAEVDDEDAHLFWCDTSAGTERLVRLARPQKLNHFPGMLEIARKKGLARNLANMRWVHAQRGCLTTREAMARARARARACTVARAPAFGLCAALPDDQQEY